MAKLDDGEVCLPEEKTIKPGEEAEAEEELFPSELTYMEELAQQLSAYALREQQQQQQTQTKPNNQTKPPTPNLQVKPLIRIGSSEGIEGNVRGTGVVHSVYASDQGGYRVELTPGYHPMKPVTTARGESCFIQASRGSRVYQKQQNQSRNRFLPFQTNDSGFLRGTGVFFPRVEATATPTEGGRKQGMNGNNKSSVGKKEVVVVGLKATTEMGLPQEWTY